ncbi:hypothetical protein Lser_V15G19648 [Lactuca serriola]
MQHMKGASVYLVGESSEINHKVSRELAVGLGYWKLLLSKQLIHVKGSNVVAEAEGVILESLSSHIRSVVATIGERHGAAASGDRWRHLYARFTVANVLFLESPAGVGFSYSNRSSNYMTGTDVIVACIDCRNFPIPADCSYPIASEERQPLSSSNSGAVSAPLFVDTLQRVGAKAELMLYEGKTCTDVFVQILWLNPMAPMKFTKNNLSLKKHHVEFVQYRVSVVASELLSQLQDWNNRRQFAHPSYFHADGVNDHFISQGIDQLCPSIGLQVHKPNLQNPNQSYLASQQHQQHQRQQQQQVLAHAQAQGKLGASPNYRFSRLSRGNIIMKDGQPLRNEGSNGIFKNAMNIERLKKYFDICGGPATFIQLAEMRLSFSIHKSV